MEYVVHVRDLKGQNPQIKVKCFGLKVRDQKSIKLKFHGLDFQFAQ